jgi:hypothetical protein
MHGADTINEKRKDERKYMSREDPGDLISGIEPPGRLRGLECHMRR